MIHINLKELKTKIYNRFFLKNGICYLKDNYVGFYKNGKLHREDGPALVSYYGEYTHWYIDGKRHREDGPAFVEYGDDYREWWINDVLVAKSEEEFNAWKLHNQLQNELEKQNTKKSINKTKI